MSEPSRFLPTFLLTLLLIIGCKGGAGGNGVTNPVTNGSGGTGGGSGGGSGGGTGGPGPSIILVSPSSITVGTPLGLLRVVGNNFTNHSQVLVDGSPLSTILDQSGVLEAQIVDLSLDFTPASHTVTVKDGSAISNAATFVVYAPHQGPLVMNAVPAFLVGSESDPSWVAVGDLDGDGFADVVIPGPPTNNSGNIAVLHGKADGSLSSPTFITGPGPSALALGDVDGDGSVDIVSLAGSSSANTLNVNVLLNDGKGNFSQASASPQTVSGIFPGPAFLADLDGDGKPDLVLVVKNAAGVNGIIYWLRNLGGGSFAAPISVASTSPDNRNFSLADFNHDGRPDIIYTAVDATSGLDVLHLLLNDGGGTFSDTPAAGLNGIVGMATPIDFNLDGIPDLVVQTAQTSAPIVLYSFIGNGDGSFTPFAQKTIAPPGFAAYKLVVGDFDHDGFLDLAGVNGETEPSHIIYLFGDGKGNFTPQQIVGPQGFFAATGDINGDGISDVIVPDRFNFVSVELGQNGRSLPSAFAISPPIATPPSAGDINGDGLKDLLIGGAIGTATFPTAGTTFLNTGNNQFQLAGSTDPSSFVLADLTGTGRADLLGFDGSNLIIWPNNGNPNFTSSSITIPGVLPPFYVADIDGDGHPDIVCRSQILFGKGSYQFTAVSIPSVNGYVVGDFNGDGRLDIATDNLTLFNLGNRNFQQVPIGPPINGAINVAVGDFNGDGKADVATTLPGDPTITVWYGRGDGTFYEATEINAGQQIGALAVGDFNGDGRLDIAAGLMLSQQVGIFFNQGQGVFSSSYFASGAFTVAMIAADLNGTGKPDLVITNFGLGFRPPNVDILFHK